MLEVIKGNLTHAVVERCAEQHCELRLDGLSNYVVLKGEQVCPDRRMCDCIIFVATESGVTIGIVELKSKTAHASEVIEKLTNASESALEILDGCGVRTAKPEFWHLVLSKRWDASEYRVITNRKIIVGGKKYPVIPKRCGTCFSAVIHSHRQA